MKNKTVKYLFSFLVLFLLLTNVTLAVALNNPLGSGVTFEGAAERIITTALGVSGVLALISFVWGGTMWAISGGDTGKIQKGKTMMIWAIMGLVVIFSSYAILSFIFKALLPDAPGSGAEESQVAPS